MENILIPDIYLDFYDYDFDSLISIFNMCDEDKMGDIKPQDILNFRGKKELKIQGRNSKFSKNMQDRVGHSIFKLKENGFLEYCKFSNSYFIIHKLNSKNYFKAPKKILNLNPKKELWGKIFALEIYKRKMEQIQIRKLFKNITIAKSLKPYKIRDNFENNMDNLCLKKIIKSWHYKEINEANLMKKDWLYEWFKLSIVVKV